MNIFEKLLGSLHLNLFARTKSPSQSNALKAKNSEIGTVQQAGRDINNFVENPQRPRILVDGGFTVSGSSQGNSIAFHPANIGDTAAVDVQWNLSADDWEGTTPEDLCNKLGVNEKSRGVQYWYNEQEIFRRKLVKPKMVFTYKDVQGNVFRSGNFITQDERADGNFNIHSRPGSYFEL